MSERLTASSRTQAESIARAAFAANVGKTIRVSYVMGYTPDDLSHEWYAPQGETIRVRVLPTDNESQTHWNDEHLDPYWDVELVERPAFIPADAASFWIDGPSIELLSTRA